MRPVGCRPGRYWPGPAAPAPSQRPGLVRPRPVGPRRRWCWLVAGGGAPGPWSACVRSRCWPPGCGGPQPPRRGALPWWRWPGRWLWPPWRGVGGLACVRAPPAPNPTSPGGGPPSGPAAGWGRPPVWGPPVVLFGLAPAAARGGQRPPGPAPCPTPGLGGTMPPGRRGFGVLPPAGGAGQKAAETAAQRLFSQQMLLHAAIEILVIHATLQCGMRLPPQGSTRQCKG